MVVVQGIRLIPTLSSISILPYVGEVMWHSCSIPIITSHIPIVKSTNIYWIYQIAKLSLIVFIHIISIYIYIYIYMYVLEQTIIPSGKFTLDPENTPFFGGKRGFQPLSAIGSSRSGPGIERSKARGCTQRGSKLVGNPRPAWHGVNSVVFINLYRGREYNIYIYI